MKNLLIYTGLGKWKDEEDATLARIQIDNSLDLGWKREDILLVTDFNYHYNGIDSLYIPEDISYGFDNKANKVAVVLYLLKHKLIADDLYWCHDFDAFENERIGNIKIDTSLGLVHYYYKGQWSLGSFFFKYGCEEVIQLINDITVTKRYKTRNNEKTLTWLIEKGHINEDQFTQLNITYNLQKRCLRTCYREAKKPIKVLHFRPSDYDDLMSNSALDMFMYGKNSLHFPLMTGRLINIFKKHGIY